MADAATKSPFTRQEVTVNGIKTEILSAGKGDPLVFWHGAGTVGGWDFTLPWAEKFRVIIPYHPGWGGSDDAPKMTAIQDYVMHYLDLFDALGLEKFHLVGLSMGGWMAATFATQHAHRLRRLALVAPAGLRVPEFPTADIFRIKPEELLGHLAVDITPLIPHLPKDPNDIDFIVGQYREQTSFARLAWERIWDPKLATYLHRIKVPTQLVWGEQDRIVPFGQAQTWSRLIPNAKVWSVRGAGHLVLNEKPEAARAVLDFLV